MTPMLLLLWAMVTLGEAGAPKDRVDNRERVMQGLPNFLQMFRQLFPDVSSDQDDVSASLPERDWFVADNHYTELKGVVNSFCKPRTLHCLDIFGFTGKIAKAWTKRNYQAESYDILRGGRSEDLLSKRGFLRLLRLSLSLVSGGAIIGGPPCCMFTFMILACKRYQKNSKDINKCQKL